MKIVLTTLAIFFIAATVLPFIRHEVWWIRIFDFPRAQIAIAGILITIVYVVLWDTKSILEDVVLGALLLCVGYQAVKMYPYTVFASDQVSRAEEIDDSTALSVLIANVLMTNRESNAFLALVNQYDPDIVLTLETDDWWSEQLAALDTEYSYVVKMPLPNTYGMILHSRKELVDPQVKYVVEDSIPSIHAKVRLDSGVEVFLHCLHPKPPYPEEDTDTVDRDAELLILGREAKERDAPTIVMGDMNDVAWSYTTTLFQKISGLLDPRIGRGMYNSYSAKNPILRWPLDHLFHSEHFSLIDLQRLPAWGSDHFSIFVHLQYSPEGGAANDRPEADAEDEEEAADKIEEAREGE